MKYTRFLIFVFVFALAAAASGVAKAAGKVWVGADGDRLASDAKNWDGQTLPTSGDAVTLPVGKIVAWDLAGAMPLSVASNAKVSLQTPLSISGDLTIGNDTFDLNGYALNVGGSLNISGGTFLPGSSNVSVSGSWNVSGGVLQLAASTVAFTGSSAKTIATNGQHFGGLVVNAGGSAVSVSDDLFVDNELTISGGTLNVGGKTLTVTGGVKLNGGSLTLGNGSLVLGGSMGRPLVISGGTMSAVGSTVSYSPVSGSVAIEPAIYGALTLDGNAMFSLSGNTLVENSMSVAAGATLSPSGYVLNIPSGRLANSGVIMDGTIHCPALSLDVRNAAGSVIAAMNDLSGNIFVRVEDGDLNRKGATAESANGLVITTMSGDKESVRMNESAPASAIFSTAGIVVHQGIVDQNNSQIEVAQNDIIFVTYVDPQDPADTKTTQVAVSFAGAVSSGMPQITAGPRIVNFSGRNTGAGTIYSAHVVWNTDKVTTSAVSVSSPLLTSPITAGSLNGTTSHDVVVSGLKRGVPYSFAVTSVTADGKSVISKARQFVVIVPGDRIKTSSSSAVYWYLNEKRNVFFDAAAYDSWFSDWNGVVTVPAEQMSDLPLGKSVPIRGGTYLIKIQSDPKTYAVEPFGKLRWIQSEAQALALYGSFWSKRVRDVDVSQFVSYEVGDPLAGNDLPSGFLYQVAGGEWSVMVGRMTHALNETGKAANGLLARFVSSVAPKMVEGLTSASAYFGHAPDINGVVADGTVAVVAPAFVN